MAIANWLDIQPLSGSGNGTVNVKAGTANTGRNARQSTLVWKAANVANVERKVVQSGKPNYVDINDTATSKKEGQVVTIKGTSNSAKLKFSLGSGDLPIAVPLTYTANSIVTNNGEAISGDPGAAAEYEFSITVTVNKNEGTTELKRQIVVTNESGQSDSCTLTLAAGSPYVTVDIGDIELGWEAGSTKSVGVLSNTTWEIF